MKLLKLGIIGLLVLLMSYLMMNQDVKDFNFQLSYIVSTCIFMIFGFFIEYSKVDCNKKIIPLYACIIMGVLIFILFIPVIQVSWLQENKVVYNLIKIMIYNNTYGLIALIVGIGLGFIIKNKIHR